MNRLLIAGMTFVGWACLMMASRTSWVEVPVGFAFEGLSASVVTAQPWSTPYFQVASASVAVYVLAAFLARGMWRRALEVVLAVWLALLLQFPWSMMVVDPTLAPHAEWLQAQHDNLTWLGGDLSTSQEQAARNWKSRLYIVDIPVSVSLPASAAWRPWQFGLRRLPQLVDWLGYTNTFSQFVRRGWLLCLFGTTCLLASSCFRHHRFVIARLRRALLTSCAITLVAFAGVWSLHFLAGKAVTQAAEFTRQGDYEMALDRLHQASQLVPVLEGDTDFVMQRGLLEHLAHRDTSTARLFAATLLEREGRFAQAETTYLSLLADESTDMTIRREACRAILRSAVDALNSGDDDQAIRQLETVLHLDPCNLKANYMLQLAYLRCGRPQAIATLLDQMYATYSCFRFPNKVAVLAAGQKNALYGFYAEGDLDRVWEHSMKSKRP